MYRIAGIVAFLVLLVNGFLHGTWSHRWEAWTDAEIQAAVARIEGLPLKIEDWEGRVVEIDPITHPVDMIGNGVRVIYENRTDKSVVSVYLACGPTDGLVSHNPQVCYPSHGFLSVPPDIRMSPASYQGNGMTQFWVSNFTKPQSDTHAHVRVFWAWSDGQAWQTPDNARRVFRKYPVIYKCYFTRQLASLEEPIEGDPCLRLMAVLLPRIDTKLNDNR